MHIMVLRMGFLLRRLHENKVYTHQAYREFLMSEGVPNMANFGK